VSTKNEVDPIFSSPPVLHKMTSLDAYWHPGAIGRVWGGYLNTYLVMNWAQTELGKDYDIYTEDGEPVGQQYPTDTGPMDLLAVKKDKTELLVVELKKGKASDVVVGQLLRYMGFVKEDLAEPNQSVRGVIIALEDDLRIRRALAVTPSIQFFRYQISFKLMKS
jgi:restriction system protein